MPQRSCDEPVAGLGAEAGAHWVRSRAAEDGKGFAPAAATPGAASGETGGHDRRQVRPLSGPVEQLERVQQSGAGGAKRSQTSCPIIGPDASQARMGRPSPRGYTSNVSSQRRGSWPSAA